MVSPLKHRLIRVALFFIIHCLLSIAAYAQSSHYVRVAVIRNAPSLRLKISGPYEIIDSVQNKVLSRGRNLHATATVYNGGILLGDIKSKTDKIFIKSHDRRVITIDGRAFRGDIQLIKKDNLYLLAVNYLGLEDYVKGTLYHEVSHYWPVEALKAQAIACRAYAFYQTQQNSRGDYDVTSDIYSQVYGGKTSERYRTNKAVDETESLLLTYQGKILPAYYHATCAGHTEDASLLWNTDIAPLKGVSCGFCKESPHFNWHSVLSAEEARKKLLDSGYNIGKIMQVQLSGTDKSGRITQLKIITATGELKILAKDFRNIIGPNIIRSTNFSVNLVGLDMVFEGFGWGHGVGLCQWGAYFMAKQGLTFKQILQYYYPGTEISSTVSH